MATELWFSRSGDERWAAVLEDSVLREIHVETADRDTARCGAIFLARVQRHMPSLDAFFADLGSPGSAFLEAPDTRVAAGQGRLDEGTDAIVQVRREAYRGKRARVTMHLQLPGRLLVYRQFAKTEGITAIRARKPAFICTKRMLKMMKIKTRISDNE